ncbi:ATP-binding protein [Sphaerisporangium album]|nr:ATP-binding protein [Sphaerisporangium album]
METVSLTIPARPEGVHQARDAVRKLITSWGPEHLIDDLILCLSEAVSNAITHAAHGSMLPVRVSRTDTCIRIEIEDGDRHPPVLALPAELVLSGRDLPDRLLEEHGRGLFLIDALATRWGVQPCPTGKIVWLERDLTKPLVQ